MEDDKQADLEMAQRKGDAASADACPSTNSPRDGSHDERECQVCLSAPRAVRFHPCGHATTCETCTLQLIAHARQKEKLVCPFCKGEIKKIERDAPSTPGSIARQKTFKLGSIPALNPGAILQHAMTGGDEDDPNALGVPAYIKAHKEGRDPDLRKAAEAAEKTWTAGPPAAPGLAGLQQQLAEAQARARVPMHWAIRVITGLMTLALICVWGWGL